MRVEGQERARGEERRREARERRERGERGAREAKEPENERMRA